MPYVRCVLNLIVVVESDANNLLWYRSNRNPESVCVMYNMKYTKSMRNLSFTVCLKKRLSPVPTRLVRFLLEIRFISYF